MSNKSPQKLPEFLTNQSPHVLVIRHEPCTSLGMLESVLKQRQIPYRYLDTRVGEVLDQPLEDFSHLVILGGTMSAYDEDQCPFLLDEFKLIERAIAQNIPTLGICLGSQILARLLGAKVYRGAAGREAGWCEIGLTDAASDDALLGEFPSRFRVFESHQDTFDLPAGSVHLANSTMYPNQAFRYGDRVWALQFHIEIDHRVLGDCRALIEQEFIDSQITDTTVEALLNEAEHHAQFVVPLADSLMGHFLEVGLEVGSRQLLPSSL